MPAEAVSAGHGLDVTTVTGVFTHNLKGIEDGQGRAVVVEGEGLVNVGEGGRHHGEHDTAPAFTEVTSSTKHEPPASSRASHPLSWTLYARPPRPRPSDTAH